MTKFERAVADALNSRIPANVRESGWMLTREQWVQEMAPYVAAAIEAVGGKIDTLDHRAIAALAALRGDAP